MTALCMAGALCSILVPVPLLASDTVSYVVQCTIPMLPGVNAPLAEEERIVVPSPVSNQETAEEALEETQAIDETQTTPTQRIITIYEQ